MRTALDNSQTSWWRPELCSWASEILCTKNPRGSALRSLSVQEQTQADRRTAEMSEWEQYAF